MELNFFKKISLYVIVQTPLRQTKENLNKLPYEIERAWRHNVILVLTQEDLESVMKKSLTKCSKTC